MKRVLTLICCFSLCSILGLAQKKNSSPAMSDQQFVNFAAQADMSEANLGQLAENSAGEQPVKDYAHKLVTDQTADFRELSQAAHKASLKMPAAIDDEHNKTMIGPFHSLKGASFDHRFAKEMVEEDTKAIDVYKKEVDVGQNLELRSYAEEALPILQADLAAARKVETAEVPAKRG